MTAPNIVNVTMITGKTVTADLTTINETSVISNAASSGAVLKINALLIANIDTVSAVTVTVNYHSAVSLGGISTQMASTISIPANSTLAATSKDSFIYLEEDRSIGVVAGTANKLKVICSYEVII